MARPLYVPQFKTEGEWARTARGTYQHMDGVIVRKDVNRCLWEIVGGKSDGEFYTTLGVAQYVVEKGLSA